MKLVPTLVKNFNGCEFKPGLMYFQYGSSVYPILGVTDRSIKYGVPGGLRSGGSLSDSSSYQITSMSVKNSFRGPRIVFKIDS